jgi:hypothetical protein
LSALLLGGQVDAEERRVALLGVVVDGGALRPDGYAQANHDRGQNQPRDELGEDEAEQHAGQDDHDDREDRERLGLLGAEREAHGRAR